MDFLDDSLFLENQDELVITVAPYGPEWEPADFPVDIAVTMEQQVQKAVDCYNAGATVVHVHAREPDGKGSKRPSRFNELLAGLREAVPDMILKVGGSISFSPETEGENAKWLSDDTRHMLAELSPKPDQVTIAIDTCQMNIVELMTEDVVFRPKWQIALDEVDRIMKSDIEFGDVLADAGYGACAAFRRGLSELKLKWAVGVNSTQLVYPKSVRVAAPERTRPGGRPPKRGKVSAAPKKARDVFSTRGKNGFETVHWRDGTKGPLSASFAAIRVRPADGPKVVGHNHGPGEEAWLICEKRASGERKYYLSNYPPDTDLGTLASAIKARWVCEQAHQQMKEELGLDHVECRSWHALRHHALLTMMAFAFLQHLRNAEKNDRAQRPAA